MRILEMVTACALLALCGSWQIKAENPKADRERMQGVWKVASVKYHLPEGEKLLRSQAWKIQGDSILIYDEVIQPDRLVEKITFTLDADKQPRRIDMYGHLGGRKAEVPLLGIYALEKNILKLSWSKIDGQFRPESFDLPEGKNKTRQVSLVLQRVKK